MNSESLSVKSPWIAYLGLLFGSFTMIEALAFQIPAMPVLAKTFSVTVASAGLISLCYYLTHIVFGPVFGNIADQIGRKRMLLIGMAIFGFSEFAAALCDNFPLFLLARAAQGLGSACVVPAGLAYASYLFPSEKRGAALGIFSAIGTAGAASGGLIGGLVIVKFGWQSIYIISGTLAFIGIGLVTVTVPETPKNERKPFDYTGSILLLVTIGTLLSVSTLIANLGAGSPFTLSAIVVGLLLSVCFWTVEKKSTHPFLELSLLKNPVFIIPLVMYFFVQVCNSSVTFTNAFFLSNKPGGGPQLVGVLTMYIYIAGAAAGLVSGKLIDMIRIKYVIIIASIGFLSAAVIYSRYTVDTPFWYVVMTVVIFTSCICMMTPACTKMALSVVPDEKLSTGSGTYTMIQYLGNPAGQTAGLAVYSALSISSLTAELTVLAQHAGVSKDLIPSLVLAGNTGGKNIPSSLAEHSAVLGINLQEMISKANISGMVHALNVMSYIIIGSAVIICIIAVFFLPDIALDSQSVKSEKA